MVSSSALSQLTTSTPRLYHAGAKKWVMAVRPGCLRWLKICSAGMPLVLEVSMASSATIDSSWVKIFFFSSTASVAASITRLQFLSWL